MPKLLRSSETRGCGATIELDDHEVVCVSIAQVGVLVRKWDMGGGLIKILWSNFFGPKLYNESNVYKNAQTAQTLSLMFPKQAPELGFSNPVLAAFANAIWHCSTAVQACVVLNEAASKTPAAGGRRQRHGRAESFRRCEELDTRYATRGVSSDVSGELLRWRDAGNASNLG